MAYIVQEALEAHTWNRNAAANWLLQGGSNQPQPSALRRSTTDRSSNAGSLMGSGGNEKPFICLKHPVVQVMPGQAWCAVSSCSGT